MTHLELFAEYRSYLFTQACRMLGSVMDAEDLLQETFLHWQQTALRTIRSPKAFLVTILRNLCRNHLQSARVRHEESLDVMPAARLAALSAMADEAIQPGRDSLPIALRIILERLPPKERTVFLLREVFDYEYEEIAAIIRKNATNCRQLLRRARQNLAASSARFLITPEQLDRLVRQFGLTCATGDLESLVALLS